MDKHLRQLAQKHWGTRFVKINAEKAPYLAEKLHIWCLPSLVLCKDGKTDHTVVGFSEFASGDEVTTDELEATLAWPADTTEGATLIIQLQLIVDSSVVDENIYWQSRPSLQQDYVALAALKNDRSKRADFGLSVDTDDEGIIQVKMQLNSGGLAFFTRLSLVDDNGDILAPVHFSDNMFTMVGDSYTKTIDIDPRDMAQRPENLRIRVSGWNTDEALYDMAGNRITPSSSSSDTLSSATIAGIAIGAVAFVGVVGGGAYAYKNRGKGSSEGGDSAKDKLIGDGNDF